MLNWLETFCAVVEEGTLTAAAAVLNRSQPTVTRHLQALEAQLGSQLLEREPYGAGGVQLTRAGRAFHPYAVEILATLGRGQRTVASLGDPNTGSLHLAAGLTPTLYFLPAVLRAYCRRFPAVSIHLVTAASHRTYEMVAQGEADAGLVTTRQEIQGIESRELFRDHLRLALPPGHPWAAETRLDARRLGSGDHDDERLPMIAFKRSSGFRRYLDQQLAAADIDIEPAIEVDTMEAAKALIRAGLGCALLPQSALDPDVEAGTLTTVRLQGIRLEPRTIRLIWQGDVPLPACATALIETIGAAAADGSPGVRQ